VPVQLARCNRWIPDQITSACRQSVNQNIPTARQIRLKLDGEALGFTGDQDIGPLAAARLPTRPRPNTPTQ